MGVWPEKLQNGLKKLREMYYSSSLARIENKIEHAKFIEVFFVEKTKIEKKYGSLLIDVKTFEDETEKSVRQ
jgi:hypothetical protein